MKTAKYIAYLFSLAVACALTTGTAKAQTLITESETPLVVPMTPERTVTFRPMMGKVKVAASVDYTVASDVDWCKVEKTDGGFTFRVSQNPDLSSRTAKVTISNEENKITRTVVIVQDASELDKYVTTPTLSVTPTKGVAESTSLSKTYDNNSNSYYVNSATTGTYTEENPLNLDYTFSDKHIDFIKYVSNDTTRGYMGKATVSYQKTGSDEFVVVGTYDLFSNGKDNKIILPNGGLDSVATLRIAVWGGLVDGETEKLSCAEMQFAVALNNTDDYSIFADELLTTLRPGVTENDIESISNPYVQDLASRIFNNSYSTAYRVGKFACLPPPNAASDTLLTTKYYDRFEGVTGIAVNPGKLVVVTSDMPNFGVTTQLIITAYRPVSGNTGPSYKTYTLKNGVNVLNYNADSVGLAYVNYVSVSSEKYDSIGIHIINGVQNGYVTNKMTNDSIATILKNAKYMCMDMLTDRMHLVFEGKSLLKYTAGQYRRLMNIYDTIMTWEHRLLGLDKYNRVPKNRMLFYVNYDYFLYDTWLGASAKNDYVTCLRPNYILTKNMDTVWGMAHEIGHHQQSTYFTWGGMTESSNNFFSVEVLLHIGEKTNDFLSSWDGEYQAYFKNDTAAGSVSPYRTGAYKVANKYSYAPKMQEVFLAMKDAKIPSRAKDEVHSASFLENGNARNSSTYRIHYYFEKERNYRDILPDFFQDLRQTERGTGKYELIASAQKQVSGRLAQLRKLYPNSVWVKNNYAHESTTSISNDAAYILNYIYKMSTATGYNLFRYFEMYGYLRQIATYIAEYGDHYYCLTEDMYNEFKEDMDARVASGELQEMSDELMNEIAGYPMPVPNTFPVLEVPN